MSEFHSHAYCLPCWNHLNRDREPVVVKDWPVEVCCSCGNATKAGIFVRGEIDQQHPFCTKRFGIPPLEKLLERGVWGFIDVRPHYLACWMEHKECLLKYLWYYAYQAMDQNDPTFELEEFELEEDMTQEYVMLYPGDGGPHEPDCD